MHASFIPSNNWIKVDFSFSQLWEKVVLQIEKLTPALAETSSSSLNVHASSFSVKLRSQVDNFLLRTCPIKDKHYYTLFLLRNK